MMHRLIDAAAVLLAALLLAGCATSARQLMPTPTLYQLPGGQPVFDRVEETRQSPDLDLLFITDRAPPTPAEVEAQTKDMEPLPYGQERARRHRLRLRPGPGGAGAGLGYPARAEPARRTHA